MVKAVLFDFYRTLVVCPEWEEIELHHLGRRAVGLLLDRGQLDRGSAVREALLADADRLYRLIRREARETNLEWSAEAAVWRIVAAMGRPAAARWGDIAAAVEDLNRACLGRVEVVPGVPAALEGLAATGCRLAVVSNAACGGFVRWALDETGLSRWFEVVAASGDLGWRKPGPRIFDWTLGRLGVCAAEAVHVGDSWRYDVVGGRAAGVGVVWLERDTGRDWTTPAGDPPMTAPEAPRPDLVLKDMGDLPRAIRGWGARPCEQPGRPAGHT